MIPASALKVAMLACVALALGAGLAFLCLEIVGVPLLIATVFLWRHVEDRSSADLSLTWLAMGTGFAGSVAWFAIRTSGIFDGSTNIGSVAWFGFWFVVGCILLGFGLASARNGLALTRQPEGSISPEVVA